MKTIDIRELETIQGGVTCGPNGEGCTQLPRPRPRPGSEPAVPSPFPRPRPLLGSVLGRQS